MATVYGNKIKNSPENLQWYTYVVYSGNTATLYGTVEGIGTTGHMWVRFGSPHIGNTSFTQQQGTYATGDVITLGSATISQTSDTSFGATCTGGEWGQNGTSEGTIPAQTPPSGLSCLVNNITRTSATLSGSVSNWGNTGASRQSETYEWGTSTSYGNTGSSLSNLTPNTTYYYRYTATNTNNLSSSITGSFVTSGNAPDISSVNITNNRTSVTLSPNVTYDTNDSYSSRTLLWGTSTSYGNSQTSLTIDNLTPNTRYYYELSITSSFNRTGSYSDSFVTSGNAPVISNVVASNITYNGATITVTAAPDTNASIVSYEIIIKDTNNNVIDTYTGSNNSYTSTSLSPNTTYMVEVIVEDNFSRFTNDISLSFNTPSNGGFKINGKMVESMRLNGKNIIGARLNGRDLF